MKNSFIKDLASVFSSRVASLALGLGTSIVTARYLGPEGNGISAALLVYPSLFMAIGALGVQQSTTYFVGQEKYDIKEIYGAVLATWIFTSLFGLISSYFLIRYFTKGHYSNTLIFWALAAIPFSLYTTYSSGIFLGQQNVKAFNRINWVPAIINLAFTFLFLAVFKLGVAGSMAATFLGVFFLSFLVVINIRKIIPVRPRFNWTIIKGLLSLGVIYAGTTLVASLNYKVDVVLLEKWSNAYELGIYSKGAVLVEMLWQIPAILSTIIFSRSAGAKDPKEFSLKVCRLLRFALILILVIAILFYCLSDFVINLMYGSAFAESSHVLKILMPGVLLMIIYKVLYMDIAGRGKPWMSMEAMIPAVIANVVLNYFWIPKYGASGSAMASTVSYSIAALVFLVLYSMHTRIPVKKIFAYTREDKDFALAIVTKFKKKIYR
ncbi:flippase [Chitinophaga sp. MM2321]|uniref:flippase n=1 Tax=Chitinophaga sp. MM2321 TaxID=3137178 RepID=UPI0032D59AD0